MVIDDDDVALLRSLMHQRDEAAVKLSALLTSAKIRSSIDFGPGAGAFGKSLDFGAVAGLSGLLPLLDYLKIGDLFQAFEHGFFFGVVDFLAADVIRAALHVRDAQRAEVLFQERNVFEEEL